MTKSNISIFLITLENEQYCIIWFSGKNILKTTSYSLIQSSIITCLLLRKEANQDGHLYY